MTDLEFIKRLVSKHALKYVKKEMIIGLGTGSTAGIFIKELAKLNRREALGITGVPTSDVSMRLAKDMGINIAGPDEINSIDIAFDGADEDATEYWEAMTRVRLEYFPDPGPAATAVRIKGMPYKGQLIQIEGIATKGPSFEERNRIMPPGSWDWSIPVPLTQGWECFRAFLMKSCQKLRPVLYTILKLQNQISLLYATYFEMFL